MCVCVCIYVYIYIHTHTTNAHTVALGGNELSAILAQERNCLPIMVELCSIGSDEAKMHASRALHNIANAGMYVCMYVCKY